MADESHNRPLCAVAMPSTDSSLHAHRKRDGRHQAPRIRIIDATTGELLRELTLDTSHRYQRTRPSTRAHPLKLKEGLTHIYWVRPSAMS